MPGIPAASCGFLLTKVGAGFLELPMRPFQTTDDMASRGSRKPAHLPEGVIGEQEEVLAGLGQEEGMHVVLFLHAGHAADAGKPPFHPSVPVQALHNFLPGP